MLLFNYILGKNRTRNFKIIHELTYRASHWESEHRVWQLFSVRRPKFTSQDLCGPYNHHITIHTLHGLSFPSPLIGDIIYNARQNFFWKYLSIYSSNSCRCDIVKFFQMQMHTAAKKKTFFDFVAFTPKYARLL